MNICTIITPNWIDRHLVRWCRYVRRSNPTANLYLIMPQQFDLGKLTGEFKGVWYDDAEPSRYWLNSIRMRGCELFGVDEMIYCDADADILEDLGSVTEDKTYEIASVPSPAIHRDWTAASLELGWGVPEKEQNNGFLVMRRSFEKEYETAWEQSGICKDNRIRGTIAFNIMLHGMEKAKELSYTTSVIWWNMEPDVMLKAKIIQYCSDKGKAKRWELEQLWRNAQV